MRLGEDLLHTGLIVCLHHDVRRPCALAHILAISKNLTRLKVLLISLTKSFGSPLQSLSMWLQREEKEKSSHNRIEADFFFWEGVEADSCNLANTRTNFI